MRSMLFISIIFFFASCEKSEIGGRTTPPPPTADSSIIEWVWETEVSEWTYILQIDPVLYGDKIYVPLLLNPEGFPSIKAFGKYDGALVDEIFPDGVVKNSFIRSRLINNHLILNGENGVKAINLDDKTVAWEYKDQHFENTGPHINTFGDYLYIDCVLDINENPHLFHEASGIKKFYWLTGERENVYIENHIDFKHFPAITQPLVQEIHGDTIITAYSLYDNIDSTARHKTKLFRYNQTKKELIWVVENLLEGGGEFAPMPYQDDILLPMGNSFYSFDAATGALNYKLSLTSSSYHANVFLLTPPVLHEGYVYLITDSGILYKIEPISGTLVYEVIDPLAKGEIKNGQLAWAQEQLLIKDDILFVNAKGEPRFAMIDIHTGKFIEDFTDEKYSGTNILYDEEADLYYITTYGKIKAFRIKD